jgi:hypothetical protein
MLINAIFYILSFIAIIYYILIWTKNNQKLKEYIIREKRKIRESWTKYKARDTLTTLKESFTGSTEDRSYTASRANCESWAIPQQTPGPYNDTDTNEYAHMDRDIYTKSNGANINPQQVAKDKLARINTVISSELPGYKTKVAGLLNTNGARVVFMNPPAYVKVISASSSQIVGTDNNANILTAKIQKYIDDPFAFNLITPENRSDILEQYPTDTWISIYSKIQLIKMEFNETVNAKISATNPEKYSKTYLQVSNIPDPNNDPVKGSNYYPSDRTHLNQEAGRRNIIQRELDKRVLSQQEYNDKWSWVDKIGEKLALPPGFNLNSDANTILDVQPRSAMDILTDYDPSQFGCPRIYQECGTRVAPGFALDAYNYEKYDKYLDSLSR